MEEFTTPGRRVDLETVAADCIPALAQYLAASRAVHVLVAASNGKVLLCNGALGYLLKSSPDQVISRYIWDLVADQDAQSLRGRLAEERTRPTEMFLLNFIDQESYPVTLECQLEVSSDYFLLLGEVPQVTNQAAQEEMLQLNNELVVLGREHVRRGKELNRVLEELKTSNWHLKKIQEVLPICMACGKVKTSSEWEDLVSYLKNNAPFLSHGYCPVCTENVQAEWMKALQQ